MKKKTIDKTKLENIDGGLTIEYGLKGQKMTYYDKTYEDETTVDQDLLKELYKCSGYKINILDVKPGEFITLYENKCLPQTKEITKLYQIYKQKG